MRFRLRRAEEPPPALPQAEAAALGGLYQELIRLERHDGASLTDRIYAIAAEQDLEPRALFRAAYRALIGAERGPRLADFILLSGRERIAPLLAPYAAPPPPAEG